MALSNLPAQQTINQYVASGTQTMFSVNYYITQPADLVVYLLLPNGTSILQILNSDYTVIQAEDPTTGGTITFVIAPANGAIVTIYRDVQADYEFDFSDPLSINGANMDSAYQQSILVSQQNNTNFLLRALKYPVFANVPTNSPDATTIPLLGANQIWIGSPSGNNEVSAQTLEENPDVSVLRSQLAANTSPTNNGTAIIGMWDPLTNIGTTLYDYLTESATGTIAPFPNSNFQSWQRGAGPFNTTGATYDGGYLGLGTGDTGSVTQIDLDPPGSTVPNLAIYGCGSRYAAQFQNAGTGTATTFMKIATIPKVSSFTRQQVIWPIAIFNVGAPFSCIALWRQNYGTAGSPTAPVDRPIPITIPSGYNIISASYTGTAFIPSTIGNTLSTDGTDRVELILTGLETVPHNFTVFNSTICPGLFATDYVSRSYGEEIKTCQSYLRQNYYNRTPASVPLSQIPIILPFTALSWGGFIEFDIPMVNLPTVTVYAGGSGNAGNVLVTSSSQAPREVAVVASATSNATINGFQVGSNVMPASGDLLWQFNYLADCGIL